jgi:hypothetical protein
VLVKHKVEVEEIAIVADDNARDVHRLVV